MSAAADIRVHAGETVILAVDVVDHNENVKQLDDATAATFTVDVAGTPLVKDLDDGITLSSSTATVTIGADETEDWAAGAYPYQLYIEDTDGVTACVVYGYVIVTAQLAAA